MSDDRVAALDDFEDWFSEACSKGAVAVVAHRNGDMDTIASAIALASARPEAMACGVHISRIARSVLEGIDAPFMMLDSESPRWPRRLGGIIVVDSAAIDQVGIELPDVPRCVIDHHATSDWSFRQGDASLIWDVSATTQIIHAYLARHSPDSLTASVRRLLLSGLITDTGRFRHADKESFLAAHDLLDGSDLDYQSFIQDMEQDLLTSSDRGAVAKALSRCEGVQAGDWWLLKTTAGTQESVVCRSLMSAGAEIAIVIRRRGGDTRLTARASRGAVLSGIHVGEILSTLSTTHGGEGGGHAGAAGWSSELDVMAVESAFIHAVSGVGRR